MPNLRNIIGDFGMLLANDPQLTQYLVRRKLLPLETAENIRLQKAATDEQLRQMREKAAFEQAQEEALWSSAFPQGGTGAPDLATPRGLSAAARVLQPFYQMQVSAGGLPLAKTLGKELTSADIAASGAKRAVADYQKGYLGAQFPERQGRLAGEAAEKGYEDTIAKLTARRQFALPELEASTQASSLKEAGVGHELGYREGLAKANLGLPEANAIVGQEQAKTTLAKLGREQKQAALGEMTDEAQARDLLRQLSVASRTPDEIEKLREISAKLELEQAKSNISRQQSLDILHDAILGDVKELPGKIENLMRDNPDLFRELVLNMAGVYRPYVPPSPFERLKAEYAKQYLGTTTAAPAPSPALDPEVISNILKAFPTTYKQQ